MAQPDQPAKRSHAIPFHPSLPQHIATRLEFLESLDGLASSGQHTENVESDLGHPVSISQCDSDNVRHGLSYSLAQRSALADGDHITFFNTESRGNVSGKVGVSLFVSGVLGDEVEVFSADDQGSVHLGRNDGAGKDTASDRNHAGERALLVCKMQSAQVRIRFLLTLSSPSWTETKVPIVP